MRSMNITQVIAGNFRDCLYDYYIETNKPIIGETLYMTIPLIGNHIEVPLFAFRALLGPLDSEAIVVGLNQIGCTTNYKSLPNNLRHALSYSYKGSHLTRIPLGNEGSYYATWGAIFDKNYLPVMLLTWEIDKVPVEGILKYKTVHPVLRIAPEVFKKTNAIEKYIVNKIIPEALSITCLEWPYRSGSNFIIHNVEDLTPDIKVIIDHCPFAIRKTAVPSISTTNKDLLNIALDNLDEIINDY